MKAGEKSWEGGRMTVKWYRAPYKGETVSQSLEELEGKGKSIITIVVPESAETKKQTKRGKEK